MSHQICGDVKKNRERIEVGCSRTLRQIIKENDESNIKYTGYVIV
jgi:hypothetical protein